MSEKFQGKYRISSTRLQNRDYGNNGAYFITICTKNRKHHFGEIMAEKPARVPSQRKMQLSGTGQLASDLWFKIPCRFPYVKLNAFVVMPNHVHGIIIIDKPGDDADGDDGNRDDADGDDADGGNCRDAINRVSTTTNGNGNLPGGTTNGETPGGITNDKNPMLHENISRIIRWYKGRVAFESRKLQPEFAWQSRFHDHIIRDHKSFLRIKKYIETNPMNWQKDVFCNKSHD